MKLPVRGKHRSVCGGHRRQTNLESPPEQAMAASSYLAVCRHHWLIEPPGGPTSTGRCLHCGSERQFNNAIDVYFKEEGDFAFVDLATEKIP